MTVLIAYDGSEHARAAIERAGELFAPGPAVVATAWSTFGGTGTGALLARAEGLRGTIEDLDAAQRETAEELANEGAGLARAVGFRAEPRALQAPGPFFAALVEAADQIEATGIVVGSRGRSALAAGVLGSVSTGVLHHTTRPVLVVRC